jgi:hypothetical protein
MPQKNETKSQDISNICPPWKLDIINFSNQQLRIDFRIEYTSKVIDCPVCECKANVIGKRPVIWKFIDFFEYETYMTAYLPVVDHHNSDCRVDHDPTVLSNYLLLDLIVRELKHTDVVNPFHYFLDAVDLA